MSLVKREILELERRMRRILKDDEEEDEDENEDPLEKKVAALIERFVILEVNYNFLKGRVIDLETNLDVLSIVGPRKHSLIKTWAQGAGEDREKAKKDGFHLYKTYQDGSVELWTD